MATGYSKGFVNYTSRDYESILADYKAMVPKLTELWTPEADADPGVVLGKYIASVADMLGVNTDWVANEIYAPTVSQRKNAEKVFGLRGYTLGWYTAARTEVTFKTNNPDGVKLDFGFAGNFCTLSADTDITNQARVITYNILPLTNAYGAQDTRSRRAIAAGGVDVFAPSDKVTVTPDHPVTRVAVEGELRSYDVAVSDIKRSNYVIKLPSQHLDTTAVWVRTKPSTTSSTNIQWIQVETPVEFSTPEPRFAVTYDNYSNAQIQFSAYIDQIENYGDQTVTVYWIDCSGVIGCVGQNVLSNLLYAIPNTDGYNIVDPNSGDLIITNLANTEEFPHTHTVTGKSPETAKQAYYNSRNYTNTFDSLVTLPDFVRFLNREPGVDCGTVIDCQKALNINLNIYNDSNLTDAQKSKMYLSKYDYPTAELNFNWNEILGLGFNPSDPNRFVFSTNFKQYTAMCYAIHNDFKDSSYGQGQQAVAQIKNEIQYFRYKPPVAFIEAVKRDYLPLQAMTVELDFGWVRVFPWYVVGQVYTKNPVSRSVGNNILQIIKDKLKLYFAPANRSLGQKPTVTEVVSVIQSADTRIAYFDAGSIKNPVINWNNVNVDCFNPISFARYQDLSSSATNLRIAPECLID